MKPAWLSERLAESPRELSARLEEVIRGIDPDADLPEALTEEAARHLHAIRSRLDDRAAAFELLLADGLLTLACEAAAREDAESLVERCRRMGPDGRLGELAGRWAEEV